MMTTQKNYTGKKQPTNPRNKEKHQERRTKSALIHHIENSEWEKEKKEFFYNAQREI